MKNNFYALIRQISLFLILGANSNLPTFGQEFGPETEARLQAALDRFMNDPDKPFVGGISAAIKAGNLAQWQGATGYAARNIDEQNSPLPGGTPFTTGTLLQIYSVTKTFTAPLVLELAQEGLFGLDDPISKYLPLSQINPRLNSAVTIRQLLAHESGFSDYAVEPQLQIRVAAQPGRIWTPYEAISFTNQIFPTGTDRRYSSTNYIMLGAMIEAITKKPLEQHYRERFFEPLGLESMYLGVRESPGNRGVLASPHDNISPFNPVFAQTGQPTFPNAYTNISRFPMNAIVSLAFAGGGIVSNAADLAEWGAALFEGRATSKATLDLMLNSFYAIPDVNGNYLGYGIKIIPHINDTENFLGHNGDAIGYRSVLVHQPERKVTIAVLSNFAGANPYAIAKALYQALAPEFESFSPRLALPGKTVTIKGAGLATTTSVRFNGVEAEFKIISENMVKAVVPATATEGRITLVTAGGTVESNDFFTVLHPRITAIFSERGAVGSTVILAGMRLATTQRVYFNGVKATKFWPLFDFLTLAEVPQGATTGKISVLLSGGGKAVSTSDFIITQPALMIAAKQEAPLLERKAMPAELGSLNQEQRIVAFPNPMREKVTLSFSLPQAQPINVKVYDIQGREVSLLYQGEAQAHQNYQLEWKPGKEQASGIYILRLQTPNQVSQQKIIFAR
jgi:CubicO group peptidase (beta-lactamase class C family)